MFKSSVQWAMLSTIIFQVRIYIFYLIWNHVIFNSELNNTRVPAGFEIEFTCGPGLALFGNKTVECLVDGFWSGQAPKCFTMIDNNYKAKDQFTTFSWISMLWAITSPYQPKILKDKWRFLKWTWIKSRIKYGLAMGMCGVMFAVFAYSNFSNLVNIRPKIAYTS